MQPSRRVEHDALEFILDPPLPCGRARGCSVCKPPRPRLRFPPDAVSQRPRRGPLLAPPVRPSPAAATSGASRTRAYAQERKRPLGHLNCFFPGFGPANRYGPAQPAAVARGPAMAYQRPSRRSGALACDRPSDGPPPRQKQPVLPFFLSRRFSFSW